MKLELNETKTNEKTRETVNNGSQAVRDYATGNICPTYTIENAFIGQSMNYATSNIYYTGVTTRRNQQGFRNYCSV